MGRGEQEKTLIGLDDLISADTLRAKPYPKISENEIFAEELPKQIFYGSEPEERYFKIPSNVYGFPKPVGGLWTSNASNDSGSDWVDTMGTFATDKSNSSFWSLEVNPKAKIFSINSYKDIYLLQNKYPAPEEFVSELKEEVFYKTAFALEPMINYDAFINDYQGLRVSQEAISESRRRFSSDIPELDWLSTWDVESVCWTSWEILHTEKL